MLNTMMLSSLDFVSAIQKQMALSALRVPQYLIKNDFLKRAGITAHVPVVKGSVGVVCRNGFSARQLKAPFDLIVMFSMGDWPKGKGYSAYFDPGSPWYNSFYGAYGIQSYKSNGTAWGFNLDGTPNFTELIQVVSLDFNFLTAGELGCPSSKMHFETGELETGRDGDWHYAESWFVVPSALHRFRDAHRPNPLYYLAFGLPDEELLKDQGSYAPVRVRGRMYFRQVADRITLIWGAICPDTPEGAQLYQEILAHMKPHHA